MRRSITILVTSILWSGIALAVIPSSADRGTVLLAKNDSHPPGLAKKGGLPPGLAKRFGPTVPARAYIAIDPKHDDRAWFLINGRWVLQEGFGDEVRVEVRSLMALPPALAPPPIPPPSIGIEFHVVLFT